MTEKMLICTQCINTKVHSVDNDILSRLQKFSPLSTSLPNAITNDVTVIHTGERVFIFALLRFPLVSDDKISMVIVHCSHTTTAIWVSSLIPVLR